ncbi:MAG: hypothetical protein HWD82_04980 [Flavobacteriaceae bacterium]|jgi:putative copper export protein|nr:hypothetical protein [Flavobacteriaceae bacterium]
MKSNKILNIIITLVAVVGGILFVRVLMQDEQAIKDNVDDLQNTVVSPIISYSFWLFIATVVTAIVLSLWSIIKNPENLKKTLGGLGVLAVILAIAYFLSDTAAVYDANGLSILEGGEEGSSTNKWVGTGIWYSTILLIIAGTFFVIDLVKGLIKS